jgi:hypothetical protein
MRKHQ